MATLTYVYADQMAVLGPLATYAEPHTYDLCISHAERLTAPMGWEIVRLVNDLPREDPDDLLAVADAVQPRRGERLPGSPPPPAATSPQPGSAAAEQAPGESASRPRATPPPGPDAGSGQSARLRLLRD